MLEARLIEGAIFKKVMDGIKDLISEATFDCNDSGIELQAMDNSHVALISLKLRDTGFEFYRCDRSMSIGLNLASLNKILKCMTSNEILTLKALDESDNVTFVFENKNGLQVSDFDFKKLVIENEYLSIPDPDYDCLIKLTSAAFSRTIRDLSQFGDSIIISCSKEDVKFSSKGEICNAKVALTKGNYDKADLLELDARNPVTLAFSSRYLMAFCKAGNLSDMVTLTVSSEYPLVVEFPIDSADGSFGHMRYFLAPKIQDGSD